MNSATININSRYYCAPSKVAQLQIAWDVIDRARELQMLDGVVFSNGSEPECRDWVLRNCEEPVEHTKGDWEIEDPLEPNLAIVRAGLTPAEWEFIATIGIGSDGDVPILEAQANAHLMKAAPKLLALLEQYHQSMPTKDSGKLICEARGWTI